MLPVMLSEKASVSRILILVGIKVVCGILIGFIADLILRLCKKTPQKSDISHICEEEHCHCEKGILRSSLVHTAQITLFIFLFSLAVGVIIYFVGEEQIASLAANAKILGPVVCGLIGLIPNCAASVVLTELFLDGIISTGSMMAGLLAGSGVGLLILFRINKNIKENLLITAVVYGSGLFVGILFDLIGVTV